MNTILKTVLIITFFTFLISCENKYPKENNANESFNTFFNKFKKNRSFQFARIKFPLEYWANDYSTNIINDKLLINYYTKNQIRFNDFKFKGKAVQNIIKKNDTVLLQIKGKDSGLLINYYFFKKSNGKWLLVKVENKSN